MSPRKENPRRVAVIMAGGSGERFWPLSRQDRPKQLLKLTSEKETLIEEAVSRISPLIPKEDIYIATTKRLVNAIKKAKLPIPTKNILAEPHKRNTAGCLCWVASELKARYKSNEVTLCILTSDHQIGTPPRFRATVKKAMESAEKNDALVTIGIPPTRPETGYGYIEVANKNSKKPSQEVVQFREKPNAQIAGKYLKSGKHFWNSGMFFWRLSVFMDEMKDASPVHGKLTEKIAEALAKKQSKKADKLFAELPDISIDFALMEKAKHVEMVKATFPWDDVGAWDSLERSRKVDSRNNVIEGDAVVLDTDECIVVNDAGSKYLEVGVVGVRNLIVIVSKDAVLVTTKERAQDVKQITQELKKKGSRQV